MQNGLTVLKKQEEKKKNAAVEIADEEIDVGGGDENETPGEDPVPAANTTYAGVDEESGLNILKFKINKH